MLRLEKGWAGWRHQDSDSQGNCTVGGVAVMVVTCHSEQLLGSMACKHSQGSIFGGSRSSAVAI